MSTISKKTRFLNYLLWIPAVAIIAACADPLSTQLPRELEKMESIKPAMEKLSQGDQALVTGYIMRQTVAAQLGGLFGIPPSAGIPEGMTLGKAIAEQKKFIAEQQAKTDTEKQASEKEATQRQALADEFSKIIEVRLIDVSLHQASFRDNDVQDYLSYTMEIKNKGIKDVTGLKGTMTVRDIFGDVIATRGMKSDSKIAAGATARSTLTRSYSKFDSDDRKEAGIDASKAKTEFSPSLVLFADGTRFDSSVAR